jgi:hypothetical protein
MPGGVNATLKAKSQIAKRGWLEVFTGKIDSSPENKPRTAASSWVAQTPLAENVLKRVVEQDSGVGRFLPMLIPMLVTACG